MKPASLLLIALIASASLAVHSSAAPKKVVVCTVTTGFRHTSIPTAEKILEKLARESKAFEIVQFVRQPDVSVPKKPNAPRKPPENADDKAKAKFEAENAKYQEALAKFDSEGAKNAQAKFEAAVKESLSALDPAKLKAAGIDGVIFANTTGDLPIPDPAGFVKWIEEGHAFMAMHSASDTFHKFAPYIEMLGGEFNGHGPQVAVTLKKMDQADPAAVGLPDSWDLAQEEMYLFKNYDRARVKDVWAMDKHPNTKEPGHFPVSWTRTAGKGNVFYTSLGHREDIWDEDPALKDRKNSPEVSKQFQQHILGGMLWALGLK